MNRKYSAILAIGSGAVAVSAVSFIGGYLYRGCSAERPQYNPPAVVRQADPSPPAADAPVSKPEQFSPVCGDKFRVLEVYSGPESSIDGSKTQYRTTLVVERIETDYGVATGQADAVTYVRPGEEKNKPKNPSRSPRENYRIHAKKPEAPAPAAPAAPPRKTYRLEVVTGDPTDPGILIKTLGECGGIVELNGSAKSGGPDYATTTFHDIHADRITVSGSPLKPGEDNGYSGKEGVEYRLVRLVQDDGLNLSCGNPCEKSWLTLYLDDLSTPRVDAVRVDVPDAGKDWKLPQIGSTIELGRKPWKPAYNDRRALEAPSITVKPERQKWMLPQASRRP